MKLDPKYRSFYVRLVIGVVFILTILISSIYHGFK